ncbi:MAG: hypothetical protein JEZ11_21220 [Desulfobacterales bacterium]|nr:hypothetical protein [Desulfobacterales bacterium]
MTTTAPLCSRPEPMAGPMNGGPGSTYGRPLVNAHCRQFEVNKWALSEFVVRRLLPVVGIHPFPLDELLLLSAAVCRLRPRHIFEWGTHVGKSARIFYETSQWLGLGATVHSIDLPDHVSHVEHPGRERGRLVQGLASVRLYQGDGLAIATALGRDLAQEAPFLFFLDGDHSEQTVARELCGVAEAFPDAAMLIHDTFYQSPESGYCTDPHAAVGNFLARSPGRYTAITAATGLPGMTLLFRKDPRPVLGRLADGSSPQGET